MNFKVGETVHNKIYICISKTKQNSQYSKNQNYEKKFFILFFTCKTNYIIERERERKKNFIY